MIEYEKFDDLLFEQNGIKKKQSENLQTKRSTFKS
jgi:hypothetical protein